MPPRTEIYQNFQALHVEGIFVIANPWDAGSAKILAELGFPALATSSAASAYALGKQDGELSRAEAMAHAHAIVEATALPVSADFGKGFGDSPDEVAETLRQGQAISLAGASIEDASGDPAQPIYPLELAVARIEAAAKTKDPARPFLLTARCENFLNGRNDLDDTIARLQAYEKAGADVLFAPGLPTLETVRAVCAAVDKPVNFMNGIPGQSFSVAELQAAGVRRISLATSLYQAAMAGLRDAAREIREQGSFAYIERL